MTATECLLDGVDHQLADRSSLADGVDHWCVSQPVHELFDEVDHPLAVVLLPGEVDHQMTATECLLDGVDHQLAD